MTTHTHGVAIWSSREWQAQAVAWLDQHLSDAGMRRTGDVEQPHLRPWGTVLKVPTNQGWVWLKAAAPSTAFEVALYEVLVRTVPARVLAPIALDRERGWLVLPDGGLPLGARLEGAELARVMTSALVQYGELQRTLSLEVDSLLDAGVADMRPARMLERFGEALTITAALIDEHGCEADRWIHARVAALAPSVALWCEQLGESPLAASLDHNDLHPWNILGDEHDARFYDWGDSVVAHPFAAMLVPLGFIGRLLDADVDGSRYERARDAYLEGFTTHATRGELVETLETACRVAKIARVLTWSRSVQTARDQGEAIDPQWLAAPMATLASLLDASYLGGA